MKHYLLATLLLLTSFGFYSCDSSKEELKAKYTFAEGNPFKAAKDGYIDAVIDAREVKPYVASALSMLL